MKPVFVAVAGNIGSGKSTIAKMLADNFGWRCFAEPTAENPYLSRFYEPPAEYAFRSQKFFLLSRIVHHETITQGEQPCVQDRSIYEDGEIFARMQRDLGYMTDSEWGKYEALYKTLVADLRAPDLLVYLRASLETLRARIRNRGHAYETRLMDPRDPYLKTLQGAYERWIDRYDRSRKLIVASDGLNLSADTVHVKKFLLTIKRTLENQVQLVNYYEPE